MHKEYFKPLSAEEERIGKLIVNAAYVVHKALLGSTIIESLKINKEMTWVFNQL